MFEFLKSRSNCKFLLFLHRINSGYIFRFSVRKKVEISNMNVTIKIGNISIVVWKFKDAIQSTDLDTPPKPLYSLNVS